MAPRSTQESGKTALDLAIELGVRADAVLQGLKQLGVETENAADAIDPDIESMLVDQLADDGQISSHLRRGKGRRKLSQDPIVDDETLKEALGASESGYQESRIPRKILLESGFEKPPSFFQRLFNKPKDLVRSLKSHKMTDDDVEALFQTRAERKTAESSPFQEMEEKAAAKFLGEEPVPQKEKLNLEEMELDEDAIEDLDEFEIGEDEDELGEIETEELEDLEDMDIGDMSDMEADQAAGEEEIELEEEEKEEEGEEEGEESEEGEEEEEGEEKEEGEEEEEEEEKKPATFFEKILSRISITQNEMWALMGGSILTMLVLLGVTIYWWMNLSPKAQFDLWTSAVDHYNKGKEYMAPDVNDWKKSRPEYEQAITEFEEFIENYEDNPNIRDAHKYLADSYYRLATGMEDSGAIEASQEPYRQMAAKYERYLQVLDYLANNRAGANLAQDEEARKNDPAYVDPAEQRMALLRIALAQRKLNKFDTAIEKLRDFIQRYQDSPEAIQARVDIGDTYQKWAQVNNEQELSLLKEATKAYQQALDSLGENDHLNRMLMNADLGDIQEKLYDRNIKNDRPEDAEYSLREAVGNYEKAEGEARNIEISTDNPNYATIAKEVKRIFNHLGGLYLIRGESAGKEWEDFEKQAGNFPDGMPSKKLLLDQAERKHEATQSYLDKAMKLYDELLAQGEVLDPAMNHDILYDKALAYKILRDYTRAIAAGEKLIGATQEVRDEVKVKTYYLLGDTAWKQATESGSQDFFKVKEYYIEALRLDPFFPHDKNGETSNLAEIRLTNVYFQMEKDYPEAIRRYEIAKGNYPNTAYTYLTLYFFGKALEEYGDDLTKQAIAKDKEAEASGNAPELKQESASLRRAAKDKYERAVEIYNNAIDAREKSRYGDPINKSYLIEIMFNRGRSAFHAGEFKKAEEYLEKFLSDFRDNEVAQQYIPDAIERLGDINIQLANYDKAIQYYKQYLNSPYEDADARVSMKIADAYRKDLDNEKAREVYRKIVKDFPPPTEEEINRLLRVGLPIKQGPAFEAMKWIAKTYDSDVGGAYTPEERNRKLMDALNAYQDLIDHYPLDSKNPHLPNDHESLRRIGDIYAELGDNEEKKETACPYYQKAADSYTVFLQLNQNYPRRGHIYWQIAKCTQQLGKCAQQPGHLLDRAIEAMGYIFPESLDTLQSYGESQLLLGKLYEERANQFLKDNPNDTDLYINYMEKAAETYNQVLAMKALDSARIAKMIDDVDNLVAIQKRYINAAPQQ